MKNNKPSIVLRIITAICFIWVLVNGAQSFITGKIYESGDIMAIVVAALPVLAGLLILIGALVGARVVFGIGAIVYLIYTGFEIYYYVTQMFQDIPAETKAGFRGLIITLALIFLAFLFLALACFNKRADLALCLLSAALFVVYFFVRRSQLPADASKWPLSLVLTSAGAVVGTILMGMTMALGKNKEKKESKYLNTSAE